MDSSPSAAAAAATMQTLFSARDAALERPSTYPQFITHVVPLVHPPSQPVNTQLHRWVAAFIAEAVASQALAQPEKQQMSLTLLEPLQSMLESPVKDVLILKSVIQASAGIYPLVFRHIVEKPSDQVTFARITAIKSIILRNFDSYPPGVRLCAIKFVQRVIQTQTAGLIADPRRPERNEVSLSLVPPSHPLLVISDLEAETSGLLDRVLGILHEPSSQVLLDTAVINAMGALAKFRPTVQSKVINAVLAFNPFKYATQPLSTKSILTIRSIERTIRALFSNIQRRNPQHPLAPRMSMYYENIQQARNKLIVDSRKRRADPGLDAESSKRVKTTHRAEVVTSVPTPPPPPPAAAIDLSMPATVAPPPPPPLPRLYKALATPLEQLTSVSYVQMFTLNRTTAINLNVKAELNPNILLRTLIPLLQTIERRTLVSAVQLAKSNLTTLAIAQEKVKAEINSAAAEDDEEYEPDLASLLRHSPDDPGATDSSQLLHLGTFKLPPPKPLATHDVNALANSMFDSLFARLSRLPDESPSISGNKLLQRAVATPENSRASIVATIVRMITRPTSGIGNSGSATATTPQYAGGSKASEELARSVRTRLLQYVLSDWTRRMDLARTWLNEEWYHDRMLEYMAKRQRGHPPGGNNKHAQKPPGLATTWTVRLLDELAAFVGTEHAALLGRFISCVPGINRDVLRSIKNFAKDPERVRMTVRLLHFLIMYRSPTREICLDALSDLYRDIPEAKKPVGEILLKYRPSAVVAAG